MSWAVYLTDHSGTRLADLTDNHGFDFVRVMNSVGSFNINLPATFDDTLLAKDYRVEELLKKLDEVAGKQYWPQSEAALQRGDKAVAREYWERMLRITVEGSTYHEMAKKALAENP